MSLFDLKARMTSDYNKYCENCHSSDSLIYVEGALTSAFENGESSIDLSVGEGWFDCRSSTFYSIEERGLPIRPGASAVIQVKEVIGLPCNVFGVITGKGTLIFQGLFVSSAKIDPGYTDHLKIGVFNGGSETIVLCKHELFCTACFFELESGAAHLQHRGSMQPTLPPQRISRIRRIAILLKKHTYAIVIAVATWVLAGTAILDLYYKVTHPQTIQSNREPLVKKQ